MQQIHLNMKIKNEKFKRKNVMTTKLLIILFTNKEMYKILS